MKHVMAFLANMQCHHVRRCFNEELLKVNTSDYRIALGHKEIYLANVP